MPEKATTIATYAAGASLAAVTLVYVFGPTFFLDDEATTSSTRKKGVVGLSNAANDCFINSVLQALAGLPDLRIYLIRETHRRNLDGPDVYLVDPDKHPDDAPVRPGKLEGLQKGLLTHGLKDILDKLNERPIYKKTISPQSFIRSLEHAFGTRISRQQQDAQEFLQIVTERLCDEYHAGTKARLHAGQHDIAPINEDDTEDAAPAPPASVPHDDYDEHDAVSPDEEGFPFEGKIESQIECLTCHFKPRPSSSTFVTLTLNVPQASSATLGACFDGMLKVEHIDDFKCEWCRLDHAVKSKEAELAKTSEPAVAERLQSDIAKIRRALEEDPENPPEDVEFPDSSQVPKRRIARHMYISKFPKVLAIHLSRSMFAVGTVSTKNLAKVSFPETLPLGGLLNRKNYKLLGMVTHKGSHNSGHYESFRRQVQQVPFSTPHSFGLDGAYSRQASPFSSVAPSINPSTNPSAAHSPRIRGAGDNAPAIPSNLALDSPSTYSLSSQSSLGTAPRGAAPTSAPRVDSDASRPSPTPSDTATISRTKSIRSLKEKASEKAASITSANPLKRKSKAANRWWRISDDKIKESKTSDVLGMQREVYLLFYELDRS